MSDIEDDAEFDKEFEGFGENDKSTIGKTTETPIETTSEEKPTATSEEKTGEDVKPPVDDKGTDKPTEEAPKPTETPETPLTPEVPQPLTKDDVSSVVRDLLNTERSSSKELETTTKEVLDAYYPDGLSNVLTDAKSGKELRTPQDVVDAYDGDISTEQAAQWLMNEQFKLDKSVADIKADAKRIAETTVNFKRDAVTAVQKYEPLFKAYPHLQQKTFDKLMTMVKADEKKGVILSAPDVMDHYDFYLEPYQKAFEFGQNKPATNPTPAPTPAVEEPPKPTAEDRMDISGDGGASSIPDYPNDFTQQVNKELAKEL